MARGRMISRTLSTSERFARLYAVAGDLAEFCQVLYLLLVAHADDWGCQPGDVFSVKLGVVPASPRTETDIDFALRYLHNVELVTWYEDSGKRFLYVRQFSAHQNLKGHDKDGRKRNCPVPPENPSVFDVSAQKCPKVPKRAQKCPKRREEDQDQDLLSEGRSYEDQDQDPVRSSKKLTTAGVSHSTTHTEDAKALSRNVAAFIKTFCDLYRKYRHGARYLVVATRDVPLVKRLLGTYPPDRLVLMAQALLVSDEDWIDDTDRGIGILSIKASWLDGRLAEYEAEHGAIAR
jgi:hypothetical protein